MKLGASSYSFRPLLRDGTMQIEDVFAWIRDNGAEHLELATFSMAPDGADVDYDLAANADTIDRLAAASRQTAIPISGICIAAHFDAAGRDERRAQIERVKRYVEVCDRLDTRFLRHDVVPWARRADTAAFERDLAGIAEACHEVATHAQRFGVTTSVEDHGFMFNAPERIIRLLNAVDLPNFRFTLDVGNFLCVDEDPVAATRAGLEHTGFVHLKDFYVRPTSPGPGWLETPGGRFIRGSVFGFGDLQARTILEEVVASGYDGFVSLEYEGNEPTLFGCETGLSNIRRMLDEITA